MVRLPQRGVERLMREATPETGSPSASIPSPSGVRDRLACESARHPARLCPRQAPPSAPGPCLGR